MITYKNIAIKGITACTPKAVMEIEDSLILSKTEKQTIKKHYGIQRVHKSKELTTFDLCLAATNHLINSIEWKNSEIDFLISVTQTPDYLMPSNSGAYQEKLQLLKNTLILEINAGCSGYIQALLLASSLLQNNKLKKGLVLCGETTYNVSEKDKASFPYMGDAGTATAIEFKEDLAGFTFNSLSNGSFANSIQILGGGAKSYTNDSTNLSAEHLKVSMDGEQVKNFIFQETLPNIKLFIEQLALDLNKVDYCIFHQVNQLLTKNLVKSLDIPTQKVLRSFEEYGNNSSASIPVCICHNATKFNNGKKSLFLAGFGIGMSNYNLYIPTFEGKVFEVIYL